MTLSCLPWQLDHSGDDSPLFTFVAGSWWWWHSPVYCGSWTTVVMTAPYLPLQLGHGGDDTLLFTMAVGPQWWWQPPIYLCSWVMVAAMVSCLPLICVTSLSTLDTSSGLKLVVRGSALMGAACKWFSFTSHFIFFPYQHTHVWRKKKKREKNNKREKN